MIISPFGIWLRELLAILIIGGGIYLLYRWYEDLPVYRRVDEPGTVREDEVRLPLQRFGERVSAWEPGWYRTAAFLAGGVGLLALSVGGRLISPRLWLRRGDKPGWERSAETHRAGRCGGQGSNHHSGSQPADRE